MGGWDFEIVEVRDQIAEVKPSKEGLGLQQNEYADNSGMDVGGTGSLLAGERVGDKED